jgi:hypothetical protein
MAKVMSVDAMAQQRGDVTVRKNKKAHDGALDEVTPEQPKSVLLQAADRVVDELSQDAQSERDVGLWINLASMGNQWARALATSNVFSMTELGLGLVKSLLDIEQAQMRALRSIDENVRLLRDGPASTGRILLEQAQHATDPNRAHRFVERANEKFYDALPLASDEREKVVVKMHIGVTALLLGQRDEAQRWLNEAYMETVGEVVALASQTGTVKVIENKKSYLGLAVGGLYFVAYKKLKKRRSAGTKSESELSFSNRSEGALRELLPVVMCLAVIHNAALLDEEADGLPALKLEEGEKKRTYQLVEVPTSAYPSAPGIV